MFLVGEQGFKLVIHTLEIANILVLWLCLGTPIEDLVQISESAMSHEHPPRAEFLPRFFLLDEITSLSFKSRPLILDHWIYGFLCPLLGLWIHLLAGPTNALRHVHIPPLRAERGGARLGPGSTRWDPGGHHSWGGKWMFHQYDGKMDGNILDYTFDYTLVYTYYSLLCHILGW